MTGLVDSGGVGGVKKWDNRIVGGVIGRSLPKVPLSSVWFSKTGHRDKSIGVNRWEGYPLFKRQRLLLLVFLLF